MVSVITTLSILYPVVLGRLSSQLAYLIEYSIPLWSLEDERTAKREKSKVLGALCLRLHWIRDRLEEIPTQQAHSLVLTVSHAR